MDNINNYVDIMILTLTRKNEVLEKIEIIAKEQNEILTDNNVKIDDIIEQLDKKDKLISELNKLDEGFENVYNRAHEEVVNNKDKYKNEIIQMQQLIKKIAEYTVKLQVYEEKNRPLFIKLFESKKSEIKQFKINSRTAARYYRNMSNVHQNGQSYFLDKKK